MGKALREVRLSHENELMDHVAVTVQAGPKPQVQIIFRAIYIRMSHCTPRGQNSGDEYKQI